jgi:8-oxo-dGTP diphosphatase
MSDRAHLMLFLAVDLAILTVRDDRLQVLVIERGNEPYRGKPALPGGFLRAGEDLCEAAERELAEETGLDGKALHLEQVKAYGAPDRDPRGRVVSLSYLAIAPDLPRPAAGSDARSAGWMPVSDIGPKLAFDHAQILGDAVERARRRLELTTLATAFCGPTFTIGDLRHVYEVVWGQELDPRNFNRKVTQTEGFVLPTGERRVRDTGRPAALYKAGPASALRPPLLRNGTSPLPARPTRTLSAQPGGISPDPRTIKLVGISRRSGGPR